MQKRGSKCIDLIAVMHRLHLFIKGCKLLEINEVIDTDYRSYIEEPSWNLPYSTEKAKRIAKLLYWKHRVDQYEEKYIDNDKLTLQKEITKINDTITRVEEAQEQYMQTQKKWTTFYKIAKKCRKDCILNFHNKEIPNENDQDRANRKWVI